MKTEQRHEEEIKKARREIFYKLYTLPWLMLVILLTGVSVSGINEINRLRERIGEKDLIELKEELQSRVTAIESPIEIPIEIIKTNVVEIVKTNVVEVIEERNVFTMGNYELGNKIGLDIEKNLKDRIKAYLEKEMGRRMGIEMGKQTDKIIEKEFEGWKTYNRN
jgi:hypothetical protein